VQSRHSPACCNSQNATLLKKATSAEPGGGIYYLLNPPAHRSRVFYFVKSDIAMKNRVGQITYAIVLVICSLIPGCTPTFQPGDVYDDTGNPVRIDTIPQRIVSLAPSNTEIVYTLGLQDRLVGVTEFCNYPPDALNKPRVGGFSTADIEKAVALQPDLILAADIHSKNVTPALQKIGFKVVTLTPRTLAGILIDIELVGKITGSERAANDLVKGLKNRIEAISQKTKALPPDKKPRVLLLLWHDPLMAAGSGTLINDLIVNAGGYNIANDIEGYKAIGLETIISRDPEVIIIPVGMEKTESPLWNYIITEPRLKNISALKNNRVYRMDGDLVYRFSPRAVSGLEQMAGFIYPQTFGGNK